MTQINDLLSWARQTSRMFGVSMERALETGASLSKLGTVTTEQGNSQLELTEPEPWPELLTEAATERRRRLVLDFVKSAGHKVNRQEATRGVLCCDGMSDDRLERVYDVIGRDLVHLRREGLLDHRRPYFWLLESDAPAKVLNGPE